jgi:hypothetical protein
MLKTILTLLFVTQLHFAQEKPTFTTYKHGHNGMELIVKSEKETIIVSTFNSKMAIKDEIAEKVYNLYKENSFINGDTLKVIGNDAIVLGKCYVKKKGKLTSVNFYYDSIEWKTGLVEFYKKMDN